MTEFESILDIEIESILASYPEIKIDNHTFILNTKIGDVIFEINEGINYPNNPPNIKLDLQKNFKKSFKLIKKVILDSFIQNEMSLILMIGTALDIATEMNTNDINKTQQQVDTLIESNNSPLMRVLIYFHHIMSSKKKAIIKSKAIEFNLGGVYCTGFPGVIVCEGNQTDVLDYVSCLQNLRWQHMVVKGEMICDEEERVFDNKGGLVLVDDMSAIANSCEEKGQKELFMTVYK